MRTISEDQRKKMQEGVGKQSGKVCKIGDNIKILVDEYQYILHIKGRTTSYFPKIEMVLEELMDFKEKELMLESDEKTLVSMYESVKKGRKWIKTVAKALSC